MYEALNQALRKCGGEVDAAESHGIICGFLCITDNPKDNQELWLQYVLQDADNVEAGRKILLSLKDIVWEQLESAYQLKLLLPLDEESLANRSAALGRWCAGFLLGLSMGGLRDNRQLSAEAAEFVEDVTKFSRINADSADGEDTEEQEKAYMELYEYIRVGVAIMKHEQTQTTPLH